MTFVKIHQCRDFPSDLVVKNLPANAGNVGSIPASGKLYKQRGNYAHEPPLLKLFRARAWEPQLLSQHSRAWALQQEKPLQWEARVPQHRVTPILRN